MSAALYVNDVGVTRKIKKLYANVNGVNRELKELWVNDGGVNRKVFSSAPPITWTRTTSIYNENNLRDSDCSFSSSYTLGVTVLHNIDYSWVHGSCSTIYTFNPRIYLTTSDYLKVAKADFTSNDDNDVREIEVLENGYTLYKGNQKDDSTKLHYGDHIPVFNRVCETIQVRASFLLHTGDDDYCAHANVQLDLYLNSVSQGIDDLILA